MVHRSHLYLIAVDAVAASSLYFCPLITGYLGLNGNVKQFNYVTISLENFFGRATRKQMTLVVHVYEQK